MTSSSPSVTGLEIAIVGMAGRFPGAPDVQAFWRNIRDGVESVAEFSEQELRARGVAAQALADPGYVRKGVQLEGMDQFDAAFFGYSPREASRMDPQQRLFLETAWEAMEHAGYGGGTGQALAGIYAGGGTSLYLLQHLLPGTDLGDGDIASALGLLNGNDSDALVSRVAYKLDLRGPAVSVQTACSTSLAAVHLACRGLLNHEVDLALAGGVWLNLLQGRGYRHQAGAILSPDGHCRAFDARAEGTTIGSGVGAVVLKRLADALADGDTVHAIIKGSAMNNDGAAKVGYTAPSIEGQAAVIQAAHAMAEVGADTIGYVEAHGTGTTLGDPIEVAALTQAFRASTARRGYCALGSVKTNVGHLDAAAGIAGLIKAAMALRHRILPPSLHFETANPQIDFAASPFHVNTQARAWEAAAWPRRAGVSSFGMGGTNVHVVLEEALPQADAQAGPEPVAQMLLLSARSEAALQDMAGRLAAHLQEQPRQALADVAHTLARGRGHFGHRGVALARDGGEAVRALGGQEPALWWHGQPLSDSPSVAFLFPGQGAQHADMGRALYEGEAVFRDTVDRCCGLLQPLLDCDLRSLLYPDEAGQEQASRSLAQTRFTQPALFVIEYAMAQWWMARGLRPDAMLGHSIGEYVAACLAGVFRLEDALRVVAARGRLLQGMEPGAMLAVGLPEAQLMARAHAGCDLAAVNAADLCVLSGPAAAIARAREDLQAQGVVARPLHVSHAFHSAMVEPMLAEFEALLAPLDLVRPRIPFVSNLSGRWITDEEACSPQYWVRHVRGAVRFSQGLGELLARPDRALLEVGPGETLSALARRHALAGSRPVLASQCHPRDPGASAGQPARCLARLWVAGIEAAAPVAPAGTAPRRVPLPTYPFERSAHWIPASGPGQRAVADAGAAGEGGDLAKALYVPVWQRLAGAVAPHLPQPATVLLLDNGSPLGRGLAAHLQTLGLTVVQAREGEGFAALQQGGYMVRPAERGDMEQLLGAVQQGFGPVAHIVHLWCWDPEDVLEDGRILDLGLHALVALAQALEATDALRGGPLALTVVASQMEDVSGTDALRAPKAALRGPCKVMPQELPGLGCRLVDAGPVTDAAACQALATRLAAEMFARDASEVVAYRGASRWTRAYAPLRWPGQAASRLRRQGVYLITGGLGGMGLALARQLARRWQARLVLVGRSALPERALWAEHLARAGAGDACAARLREVMALEALGAEVLVLQADVGDAGQMRAAVRAAVERFGRVDGAIHAAGIAGGSMLAGCGRERTAEVLHAKLQGTAHLLDALDGQEAAFVVLCSSLTAVVGGFGQSDYCAANSCLDLVAAREAQRGRHHVLSIAWDTWREVGMAAGHQLPAHAGLRPEQGADLLEALLAGPLAGQVLVSTTDLEQQMQEAGSMALADRLASAPAASQARHPRPALQSAYAEPAAGLEADLAALWSDFLGVAPIGLHDSLFELGGDSLMAIQLLARVRQDYGIDIHPAALFKQPTVAVLAELIETRLIEEIEGASAAAAATTEVG
jgi:acyl transferase domain-containing protein